MTEFDGIRLLCSLDSNKTPRIGQTALLLSHKKTKQGYIFEIGLV